MMVTEKSLDEYQKVTPKSPFINFFSTPNLFFYDQDKR